MKEQFVPKNFGSDALRLIQTINAVLDSYEAQGFDLSLRQLFYQLVSRNIVPNTERSYKNIGNLVSDARLAGLVDWDMIRDRGRSVVSNPHWDDPAAFLTSVAPQFRFNLWGDQPNYVEVMVEKQALEGVLEPVCRRLDVPFTANKGYSSSSTMYEASKRFLEAEEAGKALHIIYLGDHDPSGIDMTRDVLDRMDLFVKVSGMRAEEVGPNEIPAVEVHRVALNMDQIEELRPPENPAKLTDSRANSYVERFGRSSWELDAIEPRQLASLVENAVRGLMDVDLFERNVRKMERGREVLRKFAAEYRPDEAEEG